MRQILISWAATSSFLILAVVALRAALGRRMGAGLRYALWGLVLVRLLVPVQLFSSPVLGTVIHSERTVTRETQTVHEALDATGGQDGPQVVATAVPVLPSPPDPPEAPDAPDWRVIPAVLGWLWLAGGIVMAAVLLGCNLRFWVRLRRTRVPLPEGQADISHLPLYAAEGLPSPCLFGVFRPAIYVAPGTGPDALRHILAHEGTHYRHGDHIWGLLRCAALCVHWWNPLVWLAAKLSRRDGELACDEGALKRLGNDERTAYGNTLLVLVTAKAAPGGLLTCSTAMAGDKRSLKERFARIARAPKRAVGIATAAVILAALVTVCAFGQKTEASAPSEDPAETGAFPVEVAFTHTGTDPASGFDVPDYALDAAKALAEEQFRAVAPDGWVREWGYAWDEETGEDVPIPLPEPIEFDRVRIKSMDGPSPETVQLDGRDLGVELWQVAYEFHAVEPEQAKLLLAGGMTLDEEGWMNFCGPNYLVFTGEGDSRAVISFFTNSPSHAPGFRDGLVRALGQAGLGEVQPAAPADTATTARAALKAALLGEAGFTYFDEEGWSVGVDITTAPRTAFAITEEYGKIWEFAVVDLDGDGAEEAVLHIGDVGADMGGYLVLRRAGPGDVRCYPSYWRTFWDLKTDGTFHYDYYMGRCGTARVSFPAPGHTMEQHIILEAYYPHIDPDAGDGTFTVNGEAATQEEYDAAAAGQESKPDAAWYDFTPENVEQVLG